MYPGSATGIVEVDDATAKELAKNSYGKVLTNEEATTALEKGRIEAAKLANSATAVRKTDEQIAAEAELANSEKPVKPAKESKSTAKADDK